MTKRTKTSPAQVVLGRLKTMDWNRPTLEKLACLVIVLCAFSVPFVAIRSQGALSYDNGQITNTGQVQNNSMNGQGTLTYSNGDTYTGQFASGLFSGQGTYTSASGWTYTGNFTSGQANGQGTLTTEDGTVYEGTFEKGIYKK